MLTLWWWFLGSSASLGPSCHHSRAIPTERKLKNINSPLRGCLKWDWLMCRFRSSHHTPPPSGTWGGPGGTATEVGAIWSEMHPWGRRVTPQVQGQVRCEVGHSMPRCPATRTWAGLVVWVSTHKHSTPKHYLYFSSAWPQCTVKS